MTWRASSTSSTVLRPQRSPEVFIDNSVYLAFQTIHRHEVDLDFEPWHQFTEGGRPISPQRQRKIGPIMARQGSGVSHSGRFAGKMIVVQTLMDEAAYPWQALWYRKKVDAQLGAALDDQYRLWFVEHAMHAGGAEPVVGLALPDVVPSCTTGSLVPRRAATGPARRRRVGRAGDRAAGEH
jgi:hypothetical protein